MEERKEQVLGLWVRTKAQLRQEQADLQRAFEERYQHIQKRFANELRRLTLRLTIELDREASRPVAEAQKLFARSKLCARAGKYDLADAAHREAKQIKDQVLKQRREACNIAHGRAEARVKQNLERELAQLAAKQQAAMRDHNLKRSNHKAVIGRKKCVGETKKATEAARPKEMPSTTRRARSTSRPISSSRSSRLDGL
jgi:hypothetical protein